MRRVPLRSRRGACARRFGRPAADVAIPRPVFSRSLSAMVLLPYVVVIAWCALGFVMLTRLLGRRSRNVMLLSAGGWLVAPVVAWRELERFATVQPIGAGLAAAGMLVAALLLRFGTRKPRSKGQPFHPYIPVDAPRHAVSADNRDRRIGVLIVAYNALTTLSAVLKRIPPDV